MRFDDFDVERPRRSTRNIDNRNFEELASTQAEELRVVRAELARLRAIVNNLTTEELERAQSGVRSTSHV